MFCSSRPFLHQGAAWLSFGGGVVFLYISLPFAHCISICWHVQAISASVLLCAFRNLTFFSKNMLDLCVFLGQVWRGISWWYQL